MIQAANKIAYKDASVALMKPLEAPAENQGCLYPDLVDEASILEWAGVSLGRAEIYRLYLSIKALADSIAGDNRARFFGKIYTRGEPYYVVEMNSVYEGEEEIDPKKQEGKEGANKYTYFVSQNIEAGVPSWTKLPEVKAAQVVAASQFKRYLTGDLEAPVPTFPVFDGVEKNLLRAQIARIAGATSISPDGFFEIEEDSDPPVLKLAEGEALNERFPKAAEELKDPEQWKHHEIELNALGRATALPPQEDENGEPIEEEDPVPVTEILNPINPDTWSLRTGPSGAGVASFACAVAKSITWPGAVSVYQGRRFVNVYVGNAIAYAATPYSPPLPQFTQSEWAPGEEETGLTEEADVRADPTPPKEEEAEEE